MKTQKNNVFLSYTFFVFAFLFSGNVIYCPYYDTGKPIANFVITSFVLLIYTAFTGKFFSVRKNILRKNSAIFFALIIFVLLLVPIGSLTCDYVRTLGTFADYYAKAFTAVFSAAAVIFCAVYGANKGRICVTGFGTLVFWLLAVWTAAGFLAFFSEKNIVIPHSPFTNISKSDWIAFIKNTAYICLDITLVAVVLSNNESERTRAIVPKSMNTGAFAFVIFSGINLFKNVLLFGSDFAEHIKNPDLTAIRLIPMFELPEISVIVNTLACVLKLTLYCCFIMFVLKDAFSDRYSAGKTCGILFAGSAILCGLFYFLGEKITSVSRLAMVCLTICVLMCYVFFSVPVNRQKNIK